jgi:molybdate transport system ATP-binding protein
MKTLLLAAGAAALALCSASAFAAPSHKNGGPTVASPKQPIPYAELDSYLKASPKTRASKDWWSGQTASAAASSETSANASATAPASSSTPPK